VVAEPYRDLGMMFESRRGRHAAYTRRGTIAYVTSTSHGAEPPALLLALGATPGGPSIRRGDRAMVP
jgi:hypothetical protein